MHTLRNFFEWLLEVSQNFIDFVHAELLVTVCFFFARMILSYIFRKLRRRKFGIALIGYSKSRLKEMA